MMENGHDGRLLVESRPFSKWICMESLDETKIKKKYFAGKKKTFN